MVNESQQQDELKPNQVAQYTEPPADTNTLNPEPGPLFESNPIRLKVLRELKGKSILSARQFTKEQVIELAKLAAFLEKVEIASCHPLDGKMAITAFFEASTRTRISFESAVLRMDGKIISIPEGGTTGAKKGESLSDMAEMFNAYGDMVIMRHTETDSVDQIMRNLRVPLINAGNGSGEHPTQALADWYALLKWRPDLIDPKPSRGKSLNLGILGTPGSMRAVKSFLLMSLLFQSNIGKVTVISEMADPFGSEVIDDLKQADINYEVTHDIQQHLNQLDVIYMNSIAFLGDSYRKLDGRYKLNRESPLKKESVILHPLARADELDPDLDDTPHNLYFAQAHGAVFIRQALLISIFGRLDRLPSQIPSIES
jgi:aspartate carbamoyltransferase catalytic subunit